MGSNISRHPIRIECAAIKIILCMVVPIDSGAEVSPTCRWVGFLVSVVSIDSYQFQAFQQYVEGALNCSCPVSGSAYDIILPR